jgi:uncharacterized protein YqeY|tara:strand:- start:11 stop:334 length:324 start_codon:yes stop_codon:yes gene_type:complete
MAKKKHKMTTGEAVKVLATEMKQMKDAIMRQDMAMRDFNMALQDYIGLFEHYIEHTSDGKEFVEKMKALVEEKINEQKANEQADGQDTAGDKQDEGVGAEGVRSQEG